jgi:hypothetical protein
LKICKICKICFYYIFNIFCIFTEWLDNIGSKLVYERKENQQVLYVVPITSILGRLALVPAGDTGTIPYSMRSESALYPGATCDSRNGAGDGSRWWYVNTWAMTWSPKIWVGNSNHNKWQIKLSFAWNWHEICK